MTQHPIVTELAKAEAAYRRAQARTKDLKDKRDRVLATHRELIAQEIHTTHDTNVQIAERFGVSEGTVRNVRRETTIH